MSNEDDIVTALEHIDRVCEVRLNVTDSELEKISTAMQEPFPELKRLKIIRWSTVPRSEHENAPVLPAEFLGGSAPCLQDIFLIDISFPALPTLLLSTSDLRTLFLSNIPPGGYISPEAMVVGLAALPMLEAIVIEFQSATPRPDRIHQPP